MDRHSEIDNGFKLNKGTRNVAHIAIMMAVLTLCSKLLGFLREMIMANFFGASYVVDAYVMATAMPAILFGGIFGSVATAYMPLYSKSRESDGEKQANKFTSEVLNLLLILSILASLVGIIFSDQLVGLLASGFEGETAKLTSFFVKITFTYTLFSSTAGVFDSYLQYKGIFLSQIIAGYAQNALIISVIIISAYTSYYYLAFGMLLGMASRFALVSFIAKRRGFSYSSSFKVNEAVRNIAILAIPVFIGSSISQLSTFVDKTLASGLQEGSVSALNYAMLLVTLILSLTTVIFTTIVYPRLAQASSNEDYTRMNDILVTGVVLILMVTVPAFLGAIIYNTQIVQVVYERGAFDAMATSLTASAFMFYSIGLPFLALNDLLTKIYYSLHNMKLPMLFSCISVIIDIAFNFILVGPMAHNGLALSSSIGFMVNTFLLLFGIRKKYKMINVLTSKSKLVKVLTASLMSVGVSWFIYLYAISKIAASTIVQLGLIVSLTALLYLSLLFFFRIDEIKILKNVIKFK